MKTNFTIRLSLFYSFLFMATFSFAQKRITGIVTDESKEPLIGASVSLKGTTIGTVTDFDGRYSIEVMDSTSVLVFSYTGFMTKEILVGNREIIDVKMELGLSLEEVVITGGKPTAKKLVVAHSVATVSSPASSSAIKKLSTKKKPSSRKESKSADLFIDGVRVDMPKSGRSETKSINAGILTAGELNDFKKWDLWQDIAKEDLEEWQRYWKIKPLERYTVQLTDQDGGVVVDAEVSLLTKSGTNIYHARTDNTGKVELWSNLYDDEVPKPEKYQISVDYKDNNYFIKKPNRFHSGINALQLPVACETPQNLDIMMVVDATGSMGDEIAYLKSELKDVIIKAQKTHKSLNIKLGSVFYRDENEEYLTRKSDLSSNIEQTISFISAQSSNGGGDFPEAVESALTVAIKEMKWSKKAVARLLFLVLDAPPHYSPEILKQLHQLVEIAAQKGIKIIPVAASGIDKSTEYLMRCLSLCTNGTYVFLTDHSGVGNPHIEPTTDTYKVEKLNDLLERLINQNAKVLDCQAPIAAIKEAEIKEKDNDLEKDLKVAVFPNPTTGPLTIEMEKRVEEVLLTDVSGKVLERHAKWKKGKHRINLSQYPTGFYYLQFNTPKGIVNKKIVVQHSFLGLR